MREGTQADLARELGISRSAVCKAFRKHAIELGLDGKKFDLDYAIFLLSKKQNAVKSKSQRNARKQLPGMKNPLVFREVVRRLSWVWQATIIHVLVERAEFGQSDEDMAEMEIYLMVATRVWQVFHENIDREFGSAGDLPFTMPQSIDFDFMEVPPREQIKKILQSVSQLPPNVNEPIDYDSLPLEELERLVLADDFAAFDLIDAEPPPLPGDAPLDDPETMPESPLLPPGQELEPELPPLPNGVPKTGAGEK